MNDIDKLIESAIERKAFPGAVLVILKNDTAVKETAYGTMTWKRERAVGSGDYFDLASVSKLVVSTGIVLLAERGMIRLDDALGHYIPELKERGWLCETKLRSLLTHTAALPRRFTRTFEGMVALSLRGAEPLPDYDTARRLMLMDICNLEPIAGATDVYYTSIGHILLGFLIERVTRMPLETFLNEAIILPLGLHHLKTRLSDEQRALAVPTEFCRWRNRIIQGEVDDEIAAYAGRVMGHAGLFSTARDIACFARKVVTGRLLKPETVSLMLRDHTPQCSVPWGLGWQLLSPGSFMGGKAPNDCAGHTGFTGTSLCISAQTGLCVVFLTNRIHPSRNNTRINQFRPCLHDMVFSEYL